MGNWWLCENKFCWGGTKKDVQMVTQSHKIGTNCDNSHIKSGYALEAEQAAKVLEWSPIPPDVAALVDCLICGGKTNQATSICVPCTQELDATFGESVHPLDLQDGYLLKAPTKCECGAEKANQGHTTAGHSAWCPKFIAT
jgi:hypothetical protein